VFVKTLKKEEVKIRVDAGIRGPRETGIVAKNVHAPKSTATGDWKRKEKREVVSATPSLDTCTNIGHAQEC